MGNYFSLHISQKGLGILALLGAVLCWGPAPVFTKLALEEVPQFTLGFLSRWLALGIMVVFFFSKGYFRFQKKDLPMLILAGLLGAALNMGFFLSGIKLTTAISAQTIFTATPVVGALLGYLFFKEKITFAQMIGVGLGLLGAIVVALQGTFATGKLELGSLQGNTLIILAMVSWVLYMVVSKRLFRTYSPISVVAFSFLVGAIAFIPLFFWENMGGFGWVAAVGFKGILGILYQGIFASVLAFLTYQIGLKFTSIFMAGVILYLSPLLTPLFAVPILGERITFPFLIGAIFILFGSFFATQFDFVRSYFKQRFGR